MTEWQMFKILDKLKSTVTIIDLLPAWFLRLGATFSQDPLQACSTYPLQPYLFHTNGKSEHSTNTEDVVSFSAFGLTSGQYQSHHFCQELWKEQLSYTFCIRYLMHNYLQPSLLPISLSSVRQDCTCGHPQHGHLSIGH